MLKLVKQDVLEQREHEVEAHQLYNDSVKAYQTFSLYAREQLAACSDTYGNKATVATKVDKVKVSKILPIEEEFKIYS